MKNLIILLFLTFTFSSSAQVWIDQNANWHYKFSSIGVVGYYNLKYTQDTIIGGHSCQQIEQTSYSSWFGSTDVDTSSIETQFTYVSSDTVFYWRDNQFFTLFNFGASVGDQWLIGISDPSGGGFTCGDSSYVEVVDTGSMIINSVSYRTITLETVANSSIGLSGIYVERFGLINVSTPWHLFPRIQNCDPQVVVEWAQLTFNCFEDDSFSLYNPTGEDCELSTIGISEESEMNLSVYPNPVNDYLKIELDGEFAYEVISIRGEIITSGNSTNAKKLNLANLSPGMYVLKIHKKDWSKMLHLVKE